jgi:hypothetical protein
LTRNLSVKKCFFLCRTIGEKNAKYRERHLIWPTRYHGNSPLQDQIRTYIYHKNNTSAAAITKILSNTQIEEEQEKNSSDDCGGPEEEDALTEEIRPDQLWAMLLSVKPTPSPNLHKFICFLFSIPCSNAYVESVFSKLKHLYDDKRNRMSTELIRAELQIRLNSSLRCTQAYEYFLSKPELLKLVYSSQKYSFKKQRIN